MATLITSKKSKRSKRQLMSEINITPFVDVMLVLLVVFMVTAPMMISGINVNLPQATSAPLSGSDEPLTITVTDKGIVFLQDIEMEASQLVPKLIAITKEKKDSRILVRGDKDASYGAIMAVVGSINQAGYNHISLITQIDDKKK
jgi:biopolymer transport protein TolR